MKNIQRKVNKISGDTVVSKDESGAPISYIFDEVWKFPSKLRGVGKAATVSFAKVDLAYRKDVQRHLHRIIMQVEHSTKVSPSISTMNYYRKGLAKLLGVADGCDLSTLSDEKTYNMVARRLGNLHLSATGIDQVVSTINKLNEIGICARSSTKRDIKKSNKKTKQAIAIPISMYTKLVAKAIETVEKYHPFRHELSKVTAQAMNASARIWNESSDDEKSTNIRARVTREISKIQHSIPSFKATSDGNSLTLIQNSCLLVVLAFSGARIGEALSFNKSRFTIKSNAKGAKICILEGETTKGSSGLPMTEVWQTHPIVKDALELAEDMTDYSRVALRAILSERNTSGEMHDGDFAHALRELSGSFITTSMRSTANFTLARTDKKLVRLASSFGIKANADDVDEFNRLNPTRDGDLLVGMGLPKLSAHDFRRTFAVFFKRYGFGTATGIKFQYKHANINMSDYYANNASLQAMEDVLLDNDLLKIMKEEGISMGVDIFDDIYNKSETLSGGGGERIANDKFKRMESGHQVYMQRSEIESLIRNGTLSAVKLPTGGYCLNNKCSRICGIGQFSGEVKPCEHQLYTDSEAKDLLRQNRRLISSFREMNTGDPLMQSILIGMKHKIQLNEVTASKHKLKFDKFTDPVASMIEIREG